MLDSPVVLRWSAKSALGEVKKIRILCSMRLNILDIVLKSGPNICILCSCQSCILRMNPKKKRSISHPARDKPVRTPQTARSRILGVAGIREPDS